MLAAAPAVAQNGDEAALDSIEALQGDAAGFVALAGGLQAAVRQGDPTAFAALLDYPVTVAANGEEHAVRDAELFARDFETLVQSELQTDLVDWSASDSIVTADGVGILDGRIWFANECEDADCTVTNWTVTRIAND